VRIWLFKNFNKEERARHIIVWFFVALHFTFFTTIVGSIASQVIWVMTLLINFLFTFYVLLFFIWPGIFEKNKPVFILWFICLTIFFLFFYYIQVEQLIPKFGGRLFFTGKPLNIMISKFLINYSFIIFPSLGTYYNKKGINDIKKLLDKEKGIMERELSFLKNQFHSHLTFNFLNFCYNKVRLFSTDAANSIEEFSDLLRYSLKYKAEELVPLVKEIEYIKNYISFQKYITNNIDVNFHCKGEIEGTYIIPRILIVFVENLIKNSITDEVSNPVNINIEAVSDRIKFSIESKKNKNKSLIELKAALKGVMEILEIFYSNNYQLEISDRDDIVICELNLITTLNEANAAYLKTNDSI
jgi:two-component system LytT family sensor kinase